MITCVFLVHPLVHLIFPEIIELNNKETSEHCVYLVHSLLEVL
jgi:hypothetical protein